MEPILGRRSFSRAAALGVAGWMMERSQILRAIPGATTELGKVKIRDVQTATIMMRYPAHLVKVTTDSGLFGMGEAFNGPALCFAEAVEPLRLWFLEDPSPPENAEALVRITAATKTPICTGRKPLHASHVPAVPREAGVRHHPA